MVGVSSKTNEVSDRDLVTRCQAGHDRAFESLVIRHQARAVNVAWQLLGNREDALEVAQDAFVRVYQSLDGFRGDCEFTTWLYRIVVNLAHNKHRWWRRRGRAETETMEGDRQFVAPTVPPDAAALQNEFNRRLSAQIAALPAAFRAVLVLRNVEGLSYEEIAAVLECSQGTVKSRIARARETLREIMNHEDMPKH